MTEHKLATLEQVGSITTIEGADVIVMCKIVGRSVITKIGEFKEGETVIFLEVDSLLNPDYRWLPESFRKYAQTRRYRVDNFTISAPYA